MKITIHPVNQYLSPILIGIGARFPIAIGRSDLSVLPRKLSGVDPLAGKYPNESPYCYAGWNPVMITDPNGMWKDEGDGNWTAEQGDSWWKLHKQSGMTWKETMAYAQKYNADKGRDNWKSVRVGDKVTVGGNDNKNGSTESSTPSVDQSQYSNENIGIIEPIQVQSRSSASGSGWDPLVIAIHEFTDKGDIFPLLEMLTSGGSGAVACPAEFIAVGITTRESKWVFGAFKTEAKWASQFLKRGWTRELVTEAVTRGESFEAVNTVNKANGATRYVYPTTEQSIVIDNVTKELLHVGGPDFKY